MTKKSIALVTIPFFLDRLCKFLAMESDKVVWNNRILWGRVNIDLWTYLLILIVLFAGYFYSVRHFKVRKLTNSWPWILILIGGISNLLDRLIWGAVIDYINVWYIGWINFADIYISVGAIFLILFIFKRGETQNNS